MLYDMLECNRKGTSAYNLVRVLEDIGFKVAGVTCQLEDIKNNMLPCIAHVLLDGKYYHYVVIYQIDWIHKKIIVADPSSAIMTYEIDKFLRIFNNIVIMLYPEKPIPQYKTHNIVKQYIYKFIKLHKKNIVTFIFYSLVTLFFTLLASLLIVLLLNHNFPISNICIIVFISIYIQKNVFSFFKEHKIATIVRDINAKMMMDTFHNIIFLPYKVYCNRTTGEIVSRMRDSARASEIIGMYIMCFSMDSLLFAFALCILLKISFFGTLILLLLCIGYFTFYNLFDKNYSKILARVKRQSGKMEHEFIEAIEGFETVKGLNQEHQIVDKVYSNYQLYLKEACTLEKRRIGQATLGNFLEDMIYLWISLLGIYMFRHHVFSLETFLLFYSLSSYIVMPIKDFVGCIHDTKELREILDRIHDFSWEEEVSGKSCNRIKTLECKQLYLEQNDFKTPMFDCTFYLKDRIFIYGKSGGGKSTFLKILKGYYPSYQGEIYINQNKIGIYDKKTIQKCIVYVSQQETLFTNTVYENICMGKKIATSVINKVLEITQVNDILKQRHIGLHTLIEENGCNFSGGERQRIILARTLLQDASMYLFDESFSEMDANMERIILKNIMKSYPLKTFVVVSHRLDNQDLFNAHMYVEANAATFLRESQKERRILCLDG